MLRSHRQSEVCILKINIPGASTLFPERSRLQSTGEKSGVDTPGTVQETLKITRGKFSLDSRWKPPATLLIRSPTNVSRVLLKDLVFGRGGFVVEGISKGSHRRGG